MKAIELQLEFDTFKHEFKLTKGVFKAGYLHDNGPQSFNLIRMAKTDTETLIIDNGPHDAAAIDTTLAPRNFHLRYAKGQAGRSINIYHWLEYMIRTDRFTFFKENDNYMKRQIGELLDRFKISYDTFNLDDGNKLYIHRLLWCRSCKGTGKVRSKMNPKDNADLIIDPTCKRCGGERIDPTVDLIQLSSRWIEFEER